MLNLNGTYKLLYKYMFIYYGLISGLIATILFDIYQNALNFSYGINKTRWDLVGRYFIGLKDKRYVRDNLNDDEVEKNELFLGYLIHYLIGIIYGYMYIIINIIFYNEPSILIAIIFGFLTILGSWCIMMPYAFNLGFFAKNSNDKYQLIVQGLIAHFIFGVGLFIGYSIIF